MERKSVSTTASSKAAIKIPILVVDDHPLYRQGLILLIDRQSDLFCCGEADSVATTLSEADAKKPAAVVLDLRLRNEDGVELIKSLKTRFPGLYILVVSTHDETVYAERSLRAGASGYVMKEEATEEVLNALRAVLRGELHISRRMAGMVVRKLFQGQPQNHGLGIDHLSDRELQVFELIGRGLTTRKIADQLFLSFKTVEAHREHIKHKLGLRGAADLTRCAAQWAQSHAQSAPQELRGER